MDILEATQINSFAYLAQQTEVSPVEKSIFVFASDELQDIISKAVQDALESPKDLRQIVLGQATKIEALNAKLEAMQKDMDSLADNQLIQLRLINELRTADHKDPGKTKITRVEKIAKYLEARPDHKASFETLKGHLGVTKNRLNEAISLLLETYPGQYGISTESRDKRKRILVLFPKLI